MTREELLERKKKLEDEIRQLEAQFNFMSGQLTGKLNLINELLETKAPPVVDSKKG